MSTFYHYRPAHVPPWRLGALLAIAAVVGGCASFSPDGGFGAVQKTAKERLGKDLVMARSDADQDTIAKRVGDMLSKPLNAGPDTLHPIRPSS